MDSGIKNYTLTPEEERIVKKALMDLIVECAGGASSVSEAASDRLKAVAEAANALARL